MAMLDLPGGNREKEIASGCLTTKVINTENPNRKTEAGTTMTQLVGQPLTAGKPCLALEFQHISTSY